MAFCPAHALCGGAVSFLLVQSTRYNHCVNMDLHMEACCPSNESRDATRFVPADMIQSRIEVKV